MSTINTKNLECDTIVAQNGNNEKEVSIPSLDKKMCFAKCIYRTPIGQTSGGFSDDSFNVSSLTVQGNNVRIVNLINSKEGTTVDYGVSATGHDNLNSLFLEVFHYPNNDTRTSIELAYYAYDASGVTPQVYSTDIIIF